MNDRIYQALSAAGLSTSPLSLLDHASTYASAFFALYDGELLYHEGGKNTQVPLRDVTRIHSDREGVLRVETSERTAVTASLVGYDPGRVQAFFQQVRDVTARAKELPVLPLKGAKTGPAGALNAGTLPGTSLPGSTVPNAGMASAGIDSAETASTGTASTGTGSSGTGMPGLSAYTPALAPTAPLVIAPTQAAPASGLMATPTPNRPPEVPLNDAGPGTPTSPESPASPGPAPAVTAAPTTPATLSPVTERAPAPRPEPVVISSMPPVSDPPAFQERAGERSRQASRAATLAAEPLAAAAVSPASTFSQGAHTQGPLVSVPGMGKDSIGGSGMGGYSTGEYTAADEGQLPSDELLRRADGVQTLARTVGLLAVVLGLAAVALAYFQWQGTGTSTNGTLSAIWTLLAGGVGAVALLAFAEALRLLAALARNSQARSAQHQRG
ncbi:hypothetical protein [Deinococcus sp.]|uniref:hypothetical protein n=1 Tax=Deinococcus sp. TaxID=47478 RepID=UPI003C7E859F